MFNKEFYDYQFSSLGSFRRVNDSRSKMEGLQDFRFYSDDTSTIDLFGCGINPLFADLVDIALAAYFADRVSCRDSRNFHRERWVRQIKLRLEVRNAGFWEQSRVKDRILDILSFLTDDEWEIEFGPQSSKDRFFESQRHLQLALPTVPRVALYSGGLDSFAGSLSQLLDNPSTPFLFVSCVTNYRQLHNQREHVSWFNHKLRRTAEVIHQPIELGFRWTESVESNREATQRSRGLLFLTFGCIAALNAGAKKLELYENGIGALNLPYDGSQISSMSSRSVNPLTLLKMQRLIGEIIGEPFEISNPFLGFTKGQMCAAIRDQDDVQRMIPLTFSCDGFPVHESGKPQCGVCTSCLLRRLSLEAAKMENCDPADGYGTDLLAMEATPSFRQLTGLRAMEYQWHCLREALSKARPWEALISRFPQLQSVVSELAQEQNRDTAVFTRALLALFGQYCEEWQGYSARQHLKATIAKAA